MKDIVITGKKLRNELFIILGCFVAACLVNVYAIIHYSRPVSELFTQIGYVAVTAVLIFAVLTVVRVVVWLVLAVVRRCLGR